MNPPSNIEQVGLTVIEAHRPPTRLYRRKMDFSSFIEEMVSAAKGGEEFEEFFDVLHDQTFLEVNDLRVSMRTVWNLALKSKGSSNQCP